MNDPRRVKVPWYSWRWRLELLLPMLLFALLAVNSLREVRTEPLLSICGALFLALALLFARQVWRERYPLRSEFGGEPAKVNNPSLQRTGRAERSF